jgi:PEP-utilising enzyme, PEP-binding domain/Putative transposase
MSEAISIQSLAKASQEAVPENDPIPGAVIAILTFGDFLGFNPHCHILVTDGCFCGKTKSDLKLGICGEHGGDPKSIEFCHIAGLNYVSCSPPFRVPIVRLAAAHAAIKNG